MVCVNGKDSPLEVGDWLCLRQGGRGSLTTLSQVTEIHDDSVVQGSYCVLQERVVAGTIPLFDGALPGYDNLSARFGYDYVSSESVDSLLKHLSSFG